MEAAADGSAERAPSPRWAARRRWGEDVIKGLLDRWRP